MGKWLGILLEHQQSSNAQEKPETVVLETAKTDETNQELTLGSLGSALKVEKSSSNQKASSNHLIQDDACEVWYRHYWSCMICQRHHTQQAKQPFLPSPCPEGEKLKKLYDQEATVNKTESTAKQ